MNIEVGDEVMLLEDWGVIKNKTWYGAVITVDDITVGKNGNKWLHSMDFGDMACSIHCEKVMKIPEQTSEID